MYKPHRTTFAVALNNLNDIFMYYMYYVCIVYITDQFL